VIEMIRAKQRLYLTDDGRMVNEHEPAGRRLFCNVGDEIRDDVAKKYGIYPDGKLPDKNADQPENKMANQPENKGGLTINTDTENQGKRGRKPKNADQPEKED
jgi:hypothetical protein